MYGLKPVPFKPNHYREMVSGESVWYIRPQPKGKIKIPA